MSRNTSEPAESLGGRPVDGGNDSTQVAGNGFVTTEEAEVGIARRKAFAGPLLDWFDVTKRDLPWRRRQFDPYAVWVSEIMLQQTQVSTVIPYFERWMARFPNLETLATASLDEVLRLWEGLGYYARARNLHRAARIVMENHHGLIPEDSVLIASLPGVGRYTAGAIRSIAYNLPSPIVDANVARVLTRVFGLDGDPKSARLGVRLWTIAESLIPANRARDFNQAMMELGALVCSPSDPACDRCPLLTACHAGQSHNPTAWPQIASGKATVRVTHGAAIIQESDRFLLIRRPPHGLWGGLWEFPRRSCENGEDSRDCAERAAREIAGLSIRVGRRVCTVKHTVTHHSITLHGFAACISSGIAAAVDCAEVRWARATELLDYPLSAPQRRLADAICARSPIQESLNV